MQNFIPKLISSDHSGCVKCRYKVEPPGLIAFLDFENAFDSVSWEFLMTTLKNFNVGSYFMKWIKIIYHKPQCAVTNNGHASDFFNYLDN